MFDLTSGLAELEARGMRRHRRLLEGPQGTVIRLDGREYLSFASNDYLGLAAHPALAEAACTAIGQYGVGAGAAHLLSGHHDLHHRFEQAAARFVGLPAALLFSTGYMANLGVVSALLDRHGAVFTDKLNHASLVDAALLSRASHQRYRHGDIDHLADLLRASPARHKLIATDSVFSMDGDLAPLPALLDLAEQHDAWLYVDDAHGFGVLGAQGRGALEHFGLREPGSRLIYLATLGKAAGVAGAFVAGATPLIEWLINKARTYLFTTAQPPALAAAALVSLRLLADEPGRRQHLARLVEHLREQAKGLPWCLASSSTPIQPLLIGDNQAALGLSDALRERSILLPAIRPPTVPEGRARLRISLSANHRLADLDRLLAALRELAP